MALNCFLNQNSSTVVAKSRFGLIPLVRGLVLFSPSTAGPYCSVHSSTRTITALLAEDCTEELPYKTFFRWNYPLKNSFLLVNYVLFKAILDLR